MPNIAIPGTVPERSPSVIPSTQIIFFNADLWILAPEELANLMSFLDYKMQFEPPKMGKVALKCHKINFLVVKCQDMSRVALQWLGIISDCLGQHACRWSMLLFACVLSDSQG